MTPRKVFLFGLCVIAIILAISAVFPDGWTTERFTIRIPDYRTWFQEDTIKYKDIRPIIASVDTAGHKADSWFLSGNDSIPEIDDRVDVATDSLQRIENQTLDFSELSENGGETFNKDKFEIPFEFPDGQDTMLFSLFRTIGKINRQNRLVRILHYGDSQIEGDRITSTIRNFMQKNYGGQGVGFIPIVPANDYAVTFQQDVSPHWKRISALGKNDEISGNRFGIAGSLARYSPPDQDDSVAHVGLRPYYIGYRNVHTFSRARLFYGPSEKPFTIVINQADTQRMAVRDAVSSAWWRFETPQNSLDLSLTSSALPDLYGITLDGAQGVAVDNLPLRGSSGLDFSRMDTAQMGQMFRMMDVQMVILQFGANIVPHIVDSYDYYARRLAQELRMFRALKPELAIVVISVNDMSQNTPKGYQSYPNIAKIRDAQKKAAFEAGCAFWDLFEAMGGENSMPSWVFAQPPLAQKDFTHFTIGGAKIVAELFCKAWTKEYQKFKVNIFPQ